MTHENRPNFKTLKQNTKKKKTLQTESLTEYVPQINISGTLLSQTQQKGIRETYLLEGSQLIYSFAGPIELYKIAEQIHKNLIRYQVEVTFLQSWYFKQKRKTP
ncbi:hypothetical protein KAW80_00600 [Candidatus Babeliales bacterium]|nr:hypothetical protein [Candidatus Babeliales bacterium]